MAEPTPRAVPNPDTDFERSDWPVRTIGLVLLGILACAVTATLVMMLAYPSSLDDVSRAVRVEPPKPRLEVDPPQDLAAFEAEQRKRLDTYYWVDSQRGIVHIPIEQAMQKLARDGIPGFPKATP